MKSLSQLRISKSQVATISLLLGIGLLAILLWRIGFHALVRDLRRAGPCVFWIVLLSGIRYLLRSVGWATSFLPGEKHRILNLLGLQIAGDALAYVSLAGPFLGEPLKAALIRDVDFSDSLGSTLLENFIYTLTAFALSLSGIVVLLLLPFTGKALSDVVCVAALAGAFVAMCALIRWQRVALPRILSWLGKKTGGRWQHLRERLETIAARMDIVNTRRPAALWIIFLLAVVAQALMLAEVVLVLRPLGVAVSLSSLLIIESATKLAKAAFFFVPGRVGADEGSSAGVVALLGMGSAVGLTLSLLRRVRALVWALLGMAYLACHAGRARAQSVHCKA